MSALAAFSLAVLAAALALPPAVLFLVNLRRYGPPPLGHPPGKPPARPTRGGSGATAASEPPARVSILIPARDEERVIGDAIEHALASEGAEVEVLVLDDASSDGTAAIVERRAAEDGRVRLVHAPPLPAGWCGKQHACHHLAAEARHEVLLFVDADVRLAPAAAASAAALLATGGAALVSGVPRQEVVSFGERLLIPLIHFVLLGFLPLGRMRRSRDPAYAAGCGQLMAARRDAYRRVGGHAAIRASRHDGLALPRAFRRAGFATDLFDATGLAVCRMYRSSREVLGGLAKNATEGLGAPRLIVPATLLLLGGQVLPWALAAAGALGVVPALAGGIAHAAAVAGPLARVAAARRFAQPLASALLHPLGILALLAIQWFALARRLRGRAIPWKGRA